ncbi:MAG: MarR family winged helix-turn-helix transcriptional regulator [Casimicrobiaceae bacterium]
MAADRLRDFGFLLKTAGRLYTKRFEQRAQALSLTLPQCRTLGHLSKNDGISQVRLAELADIEPMTLVRILDHMEAHGWVERRPDPVDRRARKLYVTAKARPVLRVIWRVAAQTRAEVLKGLSTDECSALLSLLKHVTANAAALRPLRATGKPSGAGKTVRSGRVGNTAAAIRRHSRRAP